MNLDVAENLLIGVVSGIVASIGFTIILFLIKPRIKVASKICYESVNETRKVYRIKIVNHTFFMLTNIKYKLVYCKLHGDGIKTIEEIEPRKSPVISIDEFSFFDKEMNYAIRISYDIDLQKYPLNENTRLEFIIIADHSLSSTTKCVKREYTKEQIIEGVYECGKSTRIIRKVK